MQCKLKDYGNGLLHIISHHYEDFVEFGEWLGKDLSTPIQIAKFLFEIITTQKGVCIQKIKGKWVAGPDQYVFIYAFENPIGEQRFLQIGIDDDVKPQYDGTCKPGRIHSAYPITYPWKLQDYKDFFENEIDPGGIPYKNYIIII